MAEWEPENPYEALEYMPDGKLISVACKHGVKETAKKLVEWIDSRCTEHGGNRPRFSCHTCWTELRRQVGLEGR